MCKWCANQAIPSSAKDHTAPANKSAKCPMCRKVVKHKVRMKHFSSDKPSN